MAKAVQTLVENDIPLQDALSRGYGNYSAIARLLKPKVEEYLEKIVTLEGLITAVKRAKAIYKPRLDQLEIVAGSVINLRTDVAKISIERTRRNLETTRKALAKYSESFLQVLEGATTLTLIVDQKIFSKIRSSFQSEDILDEKQSLTAIIVQSPRRIVNTPGCIVAFYNPISKSQINIEETVSCFTETIIVLRMEDAGRAFTILTDQITNAREILDKKKQAHNRVNWKYI